MIHPHVTTGPAIKVVLIDERVEQALRYFLQVPRQQLSEHNMALESSVQCPFGAEVKLRYGVPEWIEDFFGMTSRGNLVYKGFNALTGSAGIEIAPLVRRLSNEHGIHPPFLFRFEEIIQARLQFIHSSFRNAMQDHAYTSNFRYLYPVKVCHRHSVLKSVLRLGSKDKIGLEIGSRAELAMVLACVEAEGRMIVYNGHKDDTDLDAVNQATASGYCITIIVDSIEAIKQLISFASRNSWRPSVGMRVATGTLGVEDLDAKFGLMPIEAREGMRLLQNSGMLRQLRMLHIHSGPASNAVLESTIREGLLVFHDLTTAGASNLDTLDCGGGMAAYDRESREASPEASCGHSMYAKSLVSCLAATCRKLDMKQPNIILESGRALLAQHAMLVTRAVSLKKERAGIPAVVFCNMSIFRSMLDVFLERNKYCLLPIQGLAESPELEVRVADLTADKDGMLEQFEGKKTLLSLPSFAPKKQEPFFLAALGVGAYQDVLGNNHNGFGKVCEIFLSVQQGVHPSIDRGSTLAQQLQGEGFREEHTSRLKKYSLLDASTYLQ